MEGSILQCDRVRVAYGAQVVLRDVSLDVPRGCLLPLVGPNGAGKTTLLRAMLGLVPLCGGTIRTPFANSPPGYVPQVKSIDPIFPVTLRRIVEMGLYPKCGWRRRPSYDDQLRINRILIELDLFDHQHKLFGELSGGMKQKALLARAFVTDAEILLLDEPTSELDESTEDEILRRLQQWVRERGKTILFVHHGLHQAAHLSPRLCWIEHGQARIMDREHILKNGSARSMPRESS